jgi:hypothetical protein
MFKIYSTIRLFNIIKIAISSESAAHRVMVKGGAKAGLHHFWNFDLAL